MADKSKGKRGSVFPPTDLEEPIEQLPEISPESAIAAAILKGFGMVATMESNATTPNPHSFESYCLIILGLAEMPTPVDFSNMAVCKEPMLWPVVIKNEKITQESCTGLFGTSGASVIAFRHIMISVFPKGPHVEDLVNGFKELVMLANFHPSISSLDTRGFWAAVKPCTSKLRNLVWECEAAHFPSSAQAAAYLDARRTFSRSNFAPGSETLFALKKTAAASRSGSSLPITSAKGDESEGRQKSKNCYRCHQSVLTKNFPQHNAACKKRRVETPTAKAVI